MAVYTEVGFDEAASLVGSLGLGTLQTLQGVQAGIENTNYFVGTTHGRYVLTLFERLSAAELPFYLHLMKHLAERGIPVPEPRADARRALVHTVAGKPAAIVDRLDGRQHPNPDHDHAALVGAMLARMHLAAADFGMAQPNPRGLAWWTETVAIVRPFIDPSQSRLADDELAFQRHLAASPAHAALPRGPIHADLFRDNVMFASPSDRTDRTHSINTAETTETTDRADRLSGLFDFYFAGVDTWLFDLAVCLNDWCIDLATGQGVEPRAAAFVAAYERVRPLDGTEHRLLPAMLRAAAFRFWLSRLRDLHQPRPAAMLQAHDPAHFERVLRARIATPWHALPEAAPSVADTA